MTKTTERHILTHSDACGPSVLCFYTVQHLVAHVTQYITGTHTLTVILESFYLLQECQTKLNCVFPYCPSFISLYKNLPPWKIQQIKQSIQSKFYSKCHTQFVDYLYTPDMRRQIYISLHFWDVFIQGCCLLQF